MLGRVLGKYTTHLKRLTANAMTFKERVAHRKLVRANIALQTPQQAAVALTLAQAGMISQACAIRKRLTTAFIPFHHKIFKTTVKVEIIAWVKLQITLPQRGRHAAHNPRERFVLPLRK